MYVRYYQYFQFFYLLKMSAAFLPEYESITPVYDVIPFPYRPRFSFAIDESVGIFIGHTSMQASDFEQPDAKCSS